MEVKKEREREKKKEELVSVFFLSKRKNFKQMGGKEEKSLRKINKSEKIPFVARRRRRYNFKFEKNTTTRRAESDI